MLSAEIYHKWEFYKREQKPHRKSASFSFFEMLFHSSYWLELEFGLTRKKSFQNFNWLLEPPKDVSDFFSKEA